MISNAWKVRSSRGALLGALLGAMVLASCYGSNGQTKDGQSHWLEACSTAEDCGGGALCACGVCTLECGSTAVCGASSTCEAVDDRPACGDAPSGVSRVCLASCDDDDDCDTSSLTCIADSCVGDALSVLPDATVPSVDAGNDAGDARERCDVSGLACPGDQVCHIDLTCIERAVADDNGVATLAIAQEVYLSQSNPDFMGILALLATSDAIYWFDSGTIDGEPNDDAVLYRMAHDDDTPELLASGLGFVTSGLAADATSLYFSGPNGIWSIPLGGGVEPTPLVEYESVFGVPWLLHEGFVYYVNRTNGFVHRVRTDGTGDELFWDTAMTVYELAASADAVYFEVRGEDGASSLLGFNAASSTAVLEQVPFRSDLDRGRLLIVDNQLLSDLGNNQKGLQIFELSNATTRVLGEAAWLEQRSVSDGYVYSLETTVAGMPERGEYYITRTSIAGGSSERLRRATGSVGQIATGGGYLYWVEDLRLMRKAL